MQHPDDIAMLPDDEIVAALERTLEERFTFRPGWSDFGEIACEQLVDGGFWCTADYVAARYEMTMEQAQAVLDHLKPYKEALHEKGRIDEH
jgi:hypothetical protein